MACRAGDRDREARLAAMVRSRLAPVAVLLILAAHPIPTAAVPPPAIVEGEVLLDDGAGVLRLAGELRNTSGGWVCEPRVEVELFDAENRPIAVEVPAARGRGSEARRDGVAGERTWLGPGEVAPFSYVRDRRQLGGVEPVSHRLRPSARACAGPPTKMAIDNLTKERSAGGAWSVRGGIRNDGTVACRSPRAVVGLYRADGRLAHALTVVPEATRHQSLAPGELVRFERRGILDPVRGGDSSARLEVWGDCDLPR